MFCLKISPMAWLLNKKKKSRETLNPSRRRCHRAPVDITRIQNQSVCVKSAAVIHRLMGKRAVLCSGLTQPACTGTIRWGGGLTLFQASALVNAQRSKWRTEGQSSILCHVTCPGCCGCKMLAAERAVNVFFFVFFPPRAPKGVTKFHPRLGNVTVN